ncbi:MAG: DUF4386 domain-containing protein [Acidimicrobiia bacterium]|nr:DUF4386 domain-containing protein [Acidimicrobiia bacterium]
MTTTTMTAPAPLRSTLSDVSPRRAARYSGIAYLALFVLAMFANFFVREGLVVSGDAAATFANIAGSQTLFRFGLVAFLAIFILDVGIAWGLRVVFERISRQVSLVAAWFRLTYTVFLGVAAIFFFLALELVSGAGHLASFAQAQLESQVLLAVNAFNYTWLIGLVAFGLHLGLIAYLMVRSGSMSRVLAVFLAAAGAAYVVDTTAFSLLPNYTDYAGAFLAMVAIPSVIGELAFTIWLLRGGFDRPTR